MRPFIDEADSSSFVGADCAPPSPPFLRTPAAHSGTPGGSCELIGQTPARLFCLHCMKTEAFFYCQGADVTIIPNIE